MTMGKRRALGVVQLVVWTSAGLLSAGLGATLRVSASPVADSDTDAAGMEATRAADASLRRDIRNRGVAQEKVAPTQNLTGTLLVSL